MKKGIRSQLLRQASMKGLPVRMLCLALFFWITVYTPLHLLLEQHWNDPASETAYARQIALRCDDLAHGHDNHRIHSASDHKIRAACQSQTLEATSPVFLSIVEGLESPSPRFTQLFLVERVNPPGLMLCNPLLPRGPPIS